MFFTLTVVYGHIEKQYFCPLIFQLFTISKAQEYHNYLYRLVMWSKSWSPVKVSQLPSGCRFLSVNNLNNLILLLHSVFPVT